MNTTIPLESMLEIAPENMDGGRSIGFETRGPRSSCGSEMMYSSHPLPRCTEDLTETRNIENPARGKKVLMIVEEGRFASVLSDCLEKQGYLVLEAPGGAGYFKTVPEEPDLIILDLDSPSAMGMTTLKWLRRSSRVPVLAMTSAENDDSVMLAALENGANDFLTKPFSATELLARVRAVQSSARARETLHIGSLTVNLLSRTVKVGKRVVKLAATEYSLLLLFVRNAGKVLTHAEILQEIWGSNTADKVECLRVYMRNLRRKLEDNPAEPKLLLTEQTIGYRLCDAWT